MYKMLTAKIQTVAITMLICIVYTFNVQASDTFIQIPSISIDTLIVKAPLSRTLGTWDVSHLNNTVGHMEHTSWFGNVGNVVLGAHSVGLNGSADVFYHLDKVAIGDEILINDKGTIHTYQVVEIRIVDYRDTSILMPYGGETLILLTCQVGSNNGSNFYNRRHVVFANRIN